MKIYLETFGCQMNEYDSELIRSILHRHHHEFTDGLANAEAVLLNTCAIREHAHQRIYHRLDELKGIKKRGRDLIVGVLGCMAQSLREELAERAAVVDIVAGPDSYKRLPQLLASVRDQGDRRFDFSLSEFETYADIAPQRVPGVNAWVAIMRGCDNFCSFCVVPYTRGRERSREPENIISEVRRIAAEGFKQVTLLGQNVNSYRWGEVDFADLMQMVAAVPGIQRVRFTSPNPKDFPRKLLGVMAANDKLCKHIHLPLQAGSDSVLERMHRSCTSREFLELVDEIRGVMPQISLTTDIIAGFCGESDDDFAQTVEVMRQVEFDAAFIFKYSERKNTSAARKFLDDVPDEVKTSRVVRLNEMQREISSQRNRAEIGKEFDVLVEGPSKKNRNEWLGRTDHNKGVVFVGETARPGDVVRVRIAEAGTNTLRAKVEDQSSDNVATSARVAESWEAG